MNRRRDHGAGGEKVSRAEGGWVQVFEGSRVECDVVAAALDSHGIEVLGRGGMDEYVGAVFEPAQVWVRGADEPAARELIAEAGRG